jgi:hypothetical protein
MTKYRLYFMVLLSIFLITGCSGSLSTRTSSVVDDRPFIMFNFEGSIPDSPVIVFINGLRMGVAQDFPEGKKGLKIISGSHILKLQYLDQNILEKKIYLGNGLSRTISINI